MASSEGLLSTTRPNLGARMETEHETRLLLLQQSTDEHPASNQNTMSRSDLERVFAHGGFFEEMKDTFHKIDGTTEENIIRPYLISEKLCPPACEAPLASLRPILLNQLVINKVGRGLMIVVRTFTKPDSNRYLCAAVEDTRGGVDCIILQCRDHSLTAEEILPEGIVLAVKEPYYLSFPGGQHGIQVDHPSDLIELDISSDLYPTEWKDEVLAQYPKGPSQLKSEGNKAVGKKEFMRAARLYTMAASLCTLAEDALKRDILRNRAVANLSLGRFQQALSDAIASIDPSTEDMDDHHALLQYKAQCRAGWALYGLGRFEEAARHFADASKLPITQSTEAAFGGLQRAMKRVKEEKTGTYDFQTILNLIRPSEPRTDTASFLRNTKIVDFGRARGRGLVAARDIPMGELVMCEKAFVASFHHDRSSDALVDANWPNIYREPNTGTLARLPMMLMHKMLRADSADEPVFQLRSGPRKIRSGHLVDGKPVVDSLAIHSAVQFNVFLTTALCSSEMQSNFFGEVPRHNLGRLMDMMLNDSEHCGIYPHASMINHACDPNSVHTSIGDLNIIRAAKNIKKGDEITIVYEHRVDDDPRKLQEKLSLNYDFRCQCVVCKAHEQCSDQKLDERRDRLKEFHNDYHSFKFESMTKPKDPRSSAIGTSAGHPLLAKFEKHRQVIEETFPRTVYSDSVPRADLCPIAVCCAKVCHDHIKGHPELMLKWALLGLRDSGYVLAIDETQEKLTWDSAPSVQTEYLVDAALYACIAYHRLNKPVLAKRFRELAQLLWKIYTGTPVGFREKFHHADIWF
ncbi:TPR domain protein [Apiospora marii]|uniref:TPR domain protein n=1 Tax=Apiospora marii TaxID=335849 RepID=A0ABR1R1Y1_9PEZI